MAYVDIQVDFPDSRWYPSFGVGNFWNVSFGSQKLKIEILELWGLAQLHGAAKSSIVLEPAGWDTSTGVTVYRQPQMETPIMSTASGLI